MLRKFVLNRIENFYWEVFWKRGALEQSHTEKFSQNTWKVAYELHELVYC